MGLLHCHYCKAPIYKGPDCCMDNMRRQLKNSEATKEELRNRLEKQRGQLFMALEDLYKNRAIYNIDTKELERLLKLGKDLNWYR